MTTFSGHKDLAFGSVLTPPSPADSGTTMTLDAGEGATMPSTPFFATLAPEGVLPTAAVAEVVSVTGVVGDIVTFARAQGGTTAKSAASGWMLFASPTSEWADEVEDAINAAEADITAEQAALAAHIADAVGAHAATAVAFTPTGTISATTAQAAIAEVSTEFHNLGIFNVIDYGAVGDGVTNDLLAVRAAQAACTAAGGGTVFFPGGKIYLCTPDTYPAAQFTLTAGTRWLGGFDATVKLGTQGGDRTFIATSGSDIQFENLVVDGGSGNSCYLLSIGAGSRIRVTGCKFTGATIDVLLNTSGVTDLMVDHNFFLRTIDGYAVLCNFLSGSPTGSRWAICDNILRGPGGTTGGDGIELNCPATGADLQHVLVANNVITNFLNTVASGFAVGIAHVKHCIVANNAISGCGLSGIHVEDGSQEILITGNTIHDCWGPGVEVIPGGGNGTCDDGVISNNIITNCSTGEAGGTSAGIRITTAGPVAKNWIIDGNRIDNCGKITAATQYGIYAYKTDNLLCSGNHVTNIQAASFSIGIGLIGDHTIGSSINCLGNKIWNCTRGIQTAGAHVYTYIHDNDLSNNSSPVTGAPTGVVYYWDNPGYDSDVSVLAYSASITPTAQSASYFTLVATNGTAFAINNPTNAPRTAGTVVIFDIKNSSGGALGTITWGAAFLLAGAFTNPASTKRRTISFVWDGTNYVEVSRAAADI